MRRWAALWVLAIGCGDDEGAAQQSLDGGVQDASLDAARDGATDAARDASATCHSPLVPAPARSGFVGCRCVETTANQLAAGYCIDRTAIFCDAAFWRFGVDGPCFPTWTPSASGSCAAMKGTEIDAGTCPSGFDTRGAFQPRTGDTRAWDAGAGETAACCYPIDVTRSNCEGAGYRVETVASPTPSLDRRCTTGALKAFVVGEAAPALCCD